MDRDRAVERQVATSMKVIEGVFVLHDSLLGDVANAVEELGLTPPLADALWKLDPAREPPSRRELAERLHCDPSNITFLADRLEERGLVERVVARDDRRVRALTLTPAGVEARRRFASALLDALAAYGFTDRDQRQLAQLLSVVTDAGRSEQPRRGSAAHGS